MVPVGGAGAGVAGGGVKAGFGVGVAGLDAYVGWACVCPVESSFMEAEIDRNSSETLFMVTKSSSTLADS